MRAAAPRWCEEFVGWPFLREGETAAGADCYGLVCAVLSRRFGVEAPRYPGAPDLDATGRLALASGDSAPWRKVTDPRPGDVLCFDLEELHVGVYVGDGVMLHTRASGVSGTGYVHEHPWRNTLVAIYRHRGLA